MAEFFLQAEVWYVFGVGLVILDLVVGLEFFVLSFGIGAIATGIIVGLIPGTDFGEFIQLNTPVRTLLFFGVSSLLSLAPIKYFAYKFYKKGKDINKY